STRREWKTNRRLRSMSNAMAADRDTPAQKFRQPPDQRQSDPESPMCAARALLVLPEHLEDMRQELWSNPLTGIADLDDGFVVSPRERRSNGTARWREFECVGQHVPENLLQTIGIDFDEHRRICLGHLEIDLFFSRRFVDGVKCGTKGIAQLVHVYVQ